MKLQEILKESPQYANYIDRWIDKFDEDFEASLSTISEKDPALFVSFRDYNLGSYCGDGDDIESCADYFSARVSLKLMIAYSIYNVTTEKYADRMMLLKRVTRNLAPNDHNLNLGHYLLQGYSERILHDMTAGNEGPWTYHDEHTYAAFSLRDNAVNLVWNLIDEFPLEIEEDDDEDQ